MGFAVSMHHRIQGGGTESLRLTSENRCLFSSDYFLPYTGIGDTLGGVGGEAGKAATSNPQPMRNEEKDLHARKKKITCSDCPDCARPSDTCSCKTLMKALFHCAPSLLYPPLTAAAGSFLT